MKKSVETNEPQLLSDEELKDIPFIDIALLANQKRFGIENMERWAMLQGYSSWNEAFTRIHGYERHIPATASAPGRFEPELKEEAIKTGKIKVSLGIGTLFLL